MEIKVIVENALREAMNSADGGVTRHPTLDLRRQIVSRT